MLNFNLDSLIAIHEREAYGFLDFLGDLGGVRELIILGFGVFLLPLSRFSFNLKALGKLYLAHGVDSKFFEHSNMKKKNGKNKCLAMKHQIPE